jgi:hypothetical protein
LNCIYPHNGALTREWRDRVRRGPATLNCRKMGFRIEEPKGAPAILPERPAEHKGEAAWSRAARQ